MKILFFTHYSGLYGANRSMLGLIEGLSRYNIEPLIILPNEGAFCDVLKKKKIPFLIYKFNWWTDQSSYVNKLKNKIYYYHYYNFRTNSFRKKNVKSFIKLVGNSFSPNIIYSNSSVINFGFLVSKRLSIPHIWQLREFGKEDYNLSFLSTDKFVSSSFKNTNELISISNSIKNHYTKKFQLKNIQTVYNGVLNQSELKKIDCLVESRSNQILFKEIVFGIIGLIQKTKGQNDAIKALSIVCQKYPKTKLIIAGDGDTDSMYELIKKLNLENNIDYLGFVDSPFDVYKKIDVLLMCSKNEGLGRVTLEAMAAKVPTIGYKGGGTAEIIDENITGLFYENGVTDLSTKMLYAIENRMHIREMGINVRKVLENKYTNQIYADNIYEIIKKYE